MRTSFLSASPNTHFFQGLLSLSSSGGTPGQVVLQPTSEDSNNYDTLLYSAGASTNYNTYTYWELGHEGASLEYEVVRFDLSSIPAGATITGGTLEIYIEVPGHIVGTGDTITVRRILSGNSDWNYTQATYNNRKTSTAWAGSSGCATVGTDTSNTKMGEKAASSWSTGWNSITLNASELQALFANNYGFWVGTETGATGNRTIAVGLNHATAANHPKLTIDYLS